MPRRLVLTPGMIQLDDGGGRPRNRDGEFQPNDGGAVDSHTMTRAYGPPVVAAAGGAGTATLLANAILKRRRAQSR